MLIVSSLFFSYQLGDFAPFSFAWLPFLLLSMVFIIPGARNMTESHNIYELFEPKNVLIIFPFYVMASINITLNCLFSIKYVWEDSGFVYYIPWGIIPYFYLSYLAFYSSCYFLNIAFKRLKKN
jgi:hypothetical protein